MINEGFIVIDKEKGISSFGVVAALRRITGIKKIGHCGTLDPLASGVLVCAIGRSATREISKVMDGEKTYLTTLELGKTSDTYDMEGEIKEVEIEKKITKKEFEDILKNFTGDIKQVPPKHSAKKIGGMRAYELARKGVDIILKESEVNIKKIKIIDYDFPKIKIEVVCSKGTYIRSLVNDIGVALKTGAVMTDLSRLKVGKFEIDDAISIEKLDEKNINKYIIKDFKKHIA